MKHRRSSKNNPVISFVIVACAVVAGVVFFLQRTTIYDHIATHANNDYSNNNQVYIKQVVDGDTLRLSSGKRIRLIGVDTPEYYESNKLFRDAKRSGIDVKKIQHLGEQSYRFTQKLCEGKYVRLESGYERYDKYGRILAFVFLPDGTMLNERIIAEGYGLALLHFPCKQEYRDRFVAAQREAKSQQKGLWRLSPGLSTLAD